MKNFLPFILAAVFIFSCTQKPDSVEKTYYPSGAVKTEEPKLKGKDHGLLRAWYENGNLYIQQMTKYGIPHGEVIFYYPSGAIQMKGMMKNGKRSGSFYMYDEKGELIKTEKWRSGRLISR